MINSLPLFGSFVRLGSRAISFFIDSGASLSQTSGGKKHERRYQVTKLPLRVKTKISLWFTSISEDFFFLQVLRLMPACTP